MELKVINLQVMLLWMPAADTALPPSTLTRPSSPFIHSSGLLCSTTLPGPAQSGIAAHTMRGPFCGGKAALFLGMRERLAETSEAAAAASPAASIGRTAVTHCARSVSQSVSQGA